MIAHGVPANFIDGNLAMVESTSIFYVKQFAKAAVEVFFTNTQNVYHSIDTKERELQRASK